MNFADRLSAAVAERGSSLCVGLDPRIEMLPPELITGLRAGRAGRARAYERFCVGVIDAVADQAVAVKPQVAFFEAVGRLRAVRRWSGSAPMPARPACW